MNILFPRSCQLYAQLLVILPFLRVTPRPFKCGVFRWLVRDFSFEFIKLLQNDFSKQRYVTLYAFIPC